MPKPLSDATFFSRSIPDVPRDAFIIGICPIPAQRAGPDDLGWHIANFLAWKALFRGHGTPWSQTWLSRCNITKLVKARPTDYTHGPDRVVLKPAMAASLDDIPGVGMRPRNDYTHVELAAGLRDKFLDVAAKVSARAARTGAPVVMFLCGPANLRQDLLLCPVGNERQAQAEGRAVWVRSDDVRKAMMQGVTGSVGVVTVTPSPFSAGWQVNPNFCAEMPLETRADSDVFLGIQLGGLPARDLANTLLAEKHARDDDRNSQRTDETQTKFSPSMVIARDRQNGATTTLNQSLRQVSVGRFMGSLRAHTFSFVAEDNNNDDDDWEKYIGPRRGQSLAELKAKWDRMRKLGPCGKQDDNDDGDNSGTNLLGSLGHVFGGRRASQVEHIRVLAGDVLARLKEGTWAGLRSAIDGQEYELKQMLDDCLTAAAGQDDDGGENDSDERLGPLFDIVEYAATLIRLGDVLVDMLVAHERGAPAARRRRPGELQSFRVWNVPVGVTRQDAQTELVKAVEHIIPQYTERAYHHHRHHLSHGSRLGKLIETLSRAATKHCSESIAAALSASGKNPDGEIDGIRRVLDEAMQAQKRMLEASPEFRESVSLINLNDNTKSQLESRITGGPPQCFINPEETITGQRPSTPPSSLTRVVGDDLPSTSRTGSSAHIAHVPHDQPPPPSPTSSEKEKTEKLWARVVQLRDELYAVLADDEACAVKFPQMMMALEAAEAAGAVETVYLHGSRKSIFGG